MTAMVGILILAMMPITMASAQVAAPSLQSSTVTASTDIETVDRVSLSPLSGAPLLRSMRLNELHVGYHDHVSWTYWALPTNVTSASYDAVCDVFSSGFNSNNQRELEKRHIDTHIMASSIGIAKAGWEVSKLAISYLTPWEIPIPNLWRWENLGNHGARTGTILDAMKDPALGMLSFSAADVLVPPSFGAEATRCYFRNKLLGPSVKFGVNMPWSSRVQAAIFVAQVAQGFAEAWYEALSGCLFLTSKEKIALTFRLEVIAPVLLMLARIAIIHSTVIRVLSGRIDSNRYDVWATYPWTDSAVSHVSRLISLTNVLTPCTLGFLVLPYFPSLCLGLLPSVVGVVALVKVCNLQDQARSLLVEPLLASSTVEHSNVDHARRYGLRRRALLLAGAIAILWLPLMSFYSKRLMTPDTFLCPYAYLNLFSVVPNSVGGFFMIVLVGASSSLLMLSMASCFKKRLGDLIMDVTHFLWIRMGVSMASTEDELDELIKANIVIKAFWVHDNFRLAKGEFVPEGAVNTITVFLSDKNEKVRWAAASLLGHFISDATCIAGEGKLPDQAVLQLRSLLLDVNDDVSKAAVSTLSKAGFEVQEYRAEHVCAAKAASQASLWKDMVEHMTRVVACRSPLSAEEKDLLAEAFKHELAGLKEQDKAFKRLHPASFQTSKIRDQIKLLCKRAIDIAKDAAAEAPTPHNQAVYLEMQGDYYRELSTWCGEQERDSAYQCYVEAVRLMAENAGPADAERIHLEVSFTFFLVQDTCKKEEAFQVSKSAILRFNAQGQNVMDTATGLVRKALAEGLDEESTLSTLSYMLWLWEGHLERCRGEDLGGKDARSQIPRLMRMLNTSDRSAHMVAMRLVRQLLSTEENPPIQQIIDAGILPIAVEFLKHVWSPTLQLDAAWAVSNVASGTEAHTKAVVDLGALPLLVGLCQSSNEDMREQCIWALGNVAGDSVMQRDKVHEAGGLKPIMAGCLAKKLSLSRNATWALSNMFRNKPKPQRGAEEAMGVLARIVQSSRGDIDVLCDACWAISHISDDTSNEFVEIVIRSGVCESIVKLLYHTDERIVAPALRAAGNIVTGTDVQTEEMLKQGFVPGLAHLLSSNKRASIVTKACWSIPNITAGTRDQIQEISNHELIPLVIHLLQTAHPALKKKALWAISNAISGGSPQQIEFLIQCNCVPSMVGLLTEVKEAKLIIAVSENLAKILEEGKRMRQECYLPKNPYRIIVDEANGFERIYKLRDCDNEEVCQKAEEFLSKHIPAVREEMKEQGVGAQDRRLTDSACQAATPTTPPQPGSAEAASSGLADTTMLPQLSTRSLTREAFVCVRQVSQRCEMFMLDPCAVTAEAIWYNGAPPCGPYILTRSRGCSIFREPCTSGGYLLGLPENSEVDIIEVKEDADIRSRGQWGRIEEPIHGWMLLCNGGEVYVRANRVQVFTVMRSDHNKYKLLTPGGDEHSTVELEAAATLADLRACIADQVSGAFALVSPSGDTLTKDSSLELLGDLIPITDARSDVLTD